MRDYHINKNLKYRPAINIDRLWSLVDESIREKYANTKDRKAPVIDIVKHVSRLSSNKNRNSKKYFDFRAISNYLEKAFFRNNRLS